MGDIEKYAGYPSAVVYEDAKLKKPVQHLLWGDWVSVKHEDGDIATVHARGVDGFMKVSALQTERVLQIVFVDIGQGDGAIVTTPDDKHLLIDAGEGDNMLRFLRWRFGKFAKKLAFEAAVISHSDQDHYGGFDALFDENIEIETLYTNGIMERAGTDSLGPKTNGVLTDLVRTRKELDKFLANPDTWKGKRYPKMLKKGIDRGVLSKVQALSVATPFLPGYGPGDKIQIRVLGPVEEPGGKGLKWLGDVGKTKNGHSVVLHLTFRDVKILLGGDLNIPSENLLLGHHTGLPVPPKSDKDRDKLIAKARTTFQVDIAKACHHGSADVSLDFLSTLNPIATVISSGDDEAYAHPRADTLGALGARSRGDRPLIFSTELARSGKESIKQPQVLRARLRELPGLIADAPDAKAREKLEQDLEKLVTEQIDRSVAVYGAVNLRTNGKRVVLAYKVEAPRRADAKWDIYRLEPDGSGELRYTSKEDD